MILSKMVKNIPQESEIAHRLYHIHKQEEEHMPLLHKNKFARRLLHRDGVSRQTHLQGSTTVLQTQQDSHGIPQQNREL